MVSWSDAVRPADQTDSGARTENGEAAAFSFARLRGHRASKAGVVMFTKGRRPLHTVWINPSKTRATEEALRH
jgi:hypothetical protein